MNHKCRYIFLFIVLLLLLLGGSVCASNSQETIEETELQVNPEYTRYMNLSDEEKSKYEVIPDKYIYPCSVIMKDEKIYRTNSAYLMTRSVLPAKYNMADEIYIINVGGYIGESTKSEIDYAKQNNKKVKYLVQPIN